MLGWVGVTDSDWYTVLARQPFWPEVNFWTPSDFHAFHIGDGIQWAWSAVKRNAQIPGSRAGLCRSRGKE